MSAPRGRIVRMRDVRVVWLSSWDLFFREVVRDLRRRGEYVPPCLVLRANTPEFDERRPA
jgi:hypothetical protein